MNRGTVLFHSDFCFSDGQHGKKLIIILNTPKDTDPYLVCRTTSKCKYLITNEGCHSDKSIFHIKAKHDGFDLDTWIQLDELFEFSKEEILNAHFKKTCHIVNSIRSNTMSEILKCILICEDISQHHLNILFHY